LEIRQQTGKTSTSKYKAMVSRASQDGRVRDILMYCAAHTKRWGGRGLQVQNLPRGTVDADVAIQILQRNNYDWFSGCYADPMAVYSSCIRGMLIPDEGNELYVADYSSIEARVLAWLAGQESTLQLFRDREDVYCVEASGIFDRPVTKADKYERSVGKVAVLALGYQGGIGAFGTMAKGYGVDLSQAYDAIWPYATTDERERAQFCYKNYLKRCEENDDPFPLDEKNGLVADIIKQRWRAKNEKVVQFWADIQEAAINAVLTGKQCVVGIPAGFDHMYDSSIQRKITFGTIPSGVDDEQHLLCKLPSGNCTVYPFAKVHSKENDWGLVNDTLSYFAETTNYNFYRKYTYGGQLAENVTQAVARDLLADSLVRWDDAGFNTIMHVHDEGVAEHPKDDDRFQEFLNIMAVVPEWATGLPIEVSGDRMMRYRK
jgi:DNA polymerase bacteriophage-type